MRLAVVIATLAAANLVQASPGQAQDAYKIGVTAAMTGPAAATQAPVIEMLRIYVDRLNAKGGINGHQINLLIEDDQAEPSQGRGQCHQAGPAGKRDAADQSSLSSTYGPVIAEAKRAKVPLWFAGAVCPKETHPPKPDPVLFCSTGFDFSFDIPVAIKAIKDMAKEPVKIAMIGIPVPISRIGVDNAEKLATKLGMTTVDKEFIPPTTADYTPFATKIKAGDPNWGYAYAPWPAEAKTFEALRRLGWTGNYMAYGHIQAEDELNRIADGGFHIFTSQRAVPGRSAGAERDPRRRRRGQIFLPGDLRDRRLAHRPRAGAGPDQGRLAGRRRKIATAMATLNLDTQGMRGGPLVWTADNHFRTKQYYRFYRYDPDKKSIVRLRDWLEVDVSTDMRLTCRRALARPRRSGPARPHVAATRRQHRCARGDLRAREHRLRADLSRQPRAQSRAWRIDDDRRLSAGRDRGTVQRQSAARAGPGRDLRPRHGHRRLCRADALADRRSGAGCRADHHRARHLAARPGDPDLDDAAILSGGDVRLAQSAGAVAPGVQISAASLAIVVLTIVVYAGLFVFLQFTRWGMRMRAAGQNPLLAEQRGIRLHGVYAFAWGLSTFTASLAGMLLSLDSGVESHDGDHRPESVSGGAGRRPR